jgi:hypothetical protein
VENRESEQHKNLYPQLYDKRRTLVAKLIKDAGLSDKRGHLTTHPVKERALTDNVGFWAQLAGLLRPEQRDRAPVLHDARDWPVAFPHRLFRDQLLRLHVIRHPPLVIDPPFQVPSAGKVPGATRYQSDREDATAERGWISIVGRP